MSDLDEVFPPSNVLSADTVAEKRRLKALTRPRLCLTLDLPENSPEPCDPDHVFSTSVKMARLLESPTQTAPSPIPFKPNTT